MRKGGALEVLRDLFSDEDDPNEACYDPVHVGGVVIMSIAGLGVLYWLLWTLLVYEGGLPAKAAASASVLFTSKTLADVGWMGSHSMGAFEGWFGNVAALALAVLVIAALHRLYAAAADKERP